MPEKSARFSSVCPAGGARGSIFFFFFPLLASFPSRASFFAGFPSSPGFPALQDSSLSIDERARTCFVAGSTKKQKSLCYRVLCKNKNKKQTCHVIRARRLAMEPLNCLVYSSRRDDFLDYFCQKRSPLVVQFRGTHSSKRQESLFFAFLGALFANERGGGAGKRRSLKAGAF